MSSVPRTAEGEWMEIYHTQYHRHNMKFSLMHAHPGFLYYKIERQKDMRENSPLNVGDIEYIYDLLSVTLLDFFIRDMLSEFRLLISYTVLLDGLRPGEKEEKTFNIGDSINFTDRDGELHPDFFKEFKYVIENIVYKGRDSSTGEVLKISVQIRYFDYQGKQALEK